MRMKIPVMSVLDIEDSEMFSFVHIIRKHYLLSGLVIPEFRGSRAIAMGDLVFLVY